MPRQTAPDASSVVPMGDEQSERAEAVHALEAEFGELIARFRRVILENAQRLSPGMLPGAYKVFTTIVRHAPVTTSSLTETLLIDKGQVSRTVRELEQLGLVERTPDPADGRSSLLSPTADGLARLEETRRPQEHRLTRLLESWELSDIRHLTRLLHALGSGEER